MTKAGAVQDPTTIDPDAELDLEGDGLQPFNDTFLVTEAQIEDSENGQRWVVIFEAENMGDRLPNGKVRDSGYLSYTGDSEHDLVAMGRGQLKRLYKAALGRTKARVPDLEAARVQAYCSESKTGFPQIGRYKAVASSGTGGF